MAGTVNVTTFPANATMVNYVAVPITEFAIVVFVIVMTNGPDQTVLAGNLQLLVMRLESLTGKYVQDMESVNAVFVNVKLQKRVDILENSAKNVL